MSNGFRVSEHISAPIETVWAHLTDWDRAPQWMAGVDSLRASGDRPVGKGTKLLFRSRNAAREATIVEWSPPERLALRSQQGGMTAQYDYVAQADDTGTKLTLSASCEVRGLLWKLASPVIQVMMKRADAGQVAALKRLIEA